VCGTSGHLKANDFGLDVCVDERHNDREFSAARPIPALFCYDLFVLYLSFLVLSLGTSRQNSANRFLWLKIQELLMVAHRW
jgi:hypothetical protein